MITLTLAPDTLIDMRLAVSPIGEVMLSYRRLLYGRYNTNAWVVEAREALRGMRFPYLDAIHPLGSYMADFLTPPPTTNYPTIEMELAHLRQTPPEEIRRDVRHLRDSGLWVEGLQCFLDYPIESMAELTAEIELYWRLALAPHWERIHTILEGDMLYRAQQLALGGSERLFSTLSSKVVSYADGTLKVNACSNDAHQFNGGSLILKPTLFSDGTWVQHLPLDRPSITYPAYGAGLFKPTMDTAEAAATAMAITLGSAKADLLQHLAYPANTGELAQRLGITPGAVSQQLGQLRQAGLVEPYRTGRRVYYRLTRRGEKLLAVFAD